MREMEEPGFVSDIYLPRMVYAITIRSPVAKGRLKAIECPSLPSGFSLITAKDIPGENRLEDSSLPVLAEEELSYIGEPVALLLGPDKNILEDCSRNCMVQAKEEMPVFSMHERYTDMVAAKREVQIGDTEAAFAKAVSFVECSYTTGIQEHWYSEPTGAVAWLMQPEPAEGQDTDQARAERPSTCVVCTATQWPFHVKRSVAKVLGQAASAVQIKPALTGLHLDGKFWYPSLVSCHAALGAWITKRPVRLILTRREDFSFSPKRCRTEIALSSAINDKGNVSGIKISALVNLGAYGVNAQELLDHVYLGCIGAYKTRNIQFTGIAQRTNIPPQGPFAGFGLAEGLSAAELHVSRIADSLGQDPSQWRKDNFLDAGFLPLGQPAKEHFTGEQIIDSVVTMSDYRRKWASYELLKVNRKQQGNWSERGESLRGIGIALGYQGNGLLHPGQDRGSYSIELVLEKDGSLEIRTSMVGSGCDYGSIWAALASEILQIDPAKVRINSGNGCPDSGPSVLSRNISVITPLVQQACLAIRKLRFRDPLPIKVRKMIRPAKNSVWEHYFPSTSGTLDTSGLTRPGWAAAVVEVAIDPVEYMPTLRGVWMCVDGGKILSQDDARRSIKTSIVQALGWSYSEQISYVNGAIPQERYDTFDIPVPSEIPPITIDFLWNSSDDPKGIGDLPFSSVPAAYLQAVSQAMDHHFEAIPLKSLDFWYALMKKRREVGVV